MWGWAPQHSCGPLGRVIWVSPAVGTTGVGLKPSMRSKPSPRLACGLVRESPTKAGFRVFGSGQVKPSIRNDLQVGPKVGKSQQATQACWPMAYD
ncbi:hypothetical protein ACFX13_007322 [Malus domestica]